MIERSSPTGSWFFGAVQNVDIRHLRVFMTVVERKGLAAAEIDLNIGRSTISTHISELEERLGMTLCERRSKTFKLTERGELVYRAALELFTGLEKFRGQINAAHENLIGEFKFGYIDQMISHPGFKLLDALRTFHASAPKVKVTLRVSSMDIIEREVLEGTLDVGVVADYNFSPRLEYRDILVEEQQLFCGAGHHLFNQSESGLSMSSIANCDFACSGYVDPNSLSDTGITFNPSAIAYSAEALAHFVLTGRYLAFIPLHYAEQWTRQGTMRSLLPRVFSVRRQFKVIHKKGKELGDIERRFIDDLST